MSKKNEQKERKKNIQLDRPENPEELQLHHNHEEILFFDCAVALCRMQNALLVISNLT
jgi:hypothetical protein